MANWTKSASGKSAGHNENLSKALRSRVSIRKSLMAGTAIFGLAGGVFGVSLAGAILVAPNTAYANCTTPVGPNATVSCSPLDGAIPYSIISDNVSAFDSYSLLLDGSQVTTFNQGGVRLSGNGDTNVTVTTAQFGGGPNGGNPQIISRFLGAGALDIDLNGDGGNITVNHRFGSYRGTRGYGMELETNDGDIDVTIVDSPDGTFATGRLSGLRLRAGSGGTITVNNAGTVRGDRFYGIDARTSGLVDITNSSMTSMLGGLNGAYVHDSNEVIYNNDGGLTGGVFGSGVRIEDIAGFGPLTGALATVEVSNRDGGFIVGGNNGIYVDNIRDELPATGHALHIDNSGDGNTTFGGLIAGVRGDGINVDNIDGNFVVLNRNTQQGTQAFVDLLNGFPIASFDQFSEFNSFTDLNNFVLAADGLTGIFGRDDGIRGDDVGDDNDGGTYIGNENGLIVGLTGDGIDLTDLGDADAVAGNFSAYIDNAGGAILGLADEGIDIDGAGGNIFIGNGSSSIGPGSQTVGGGIIAGFEGSNDGDGVSVEDVDGNVIINNYSSLIYSDENDAVSIDGAIMAMVGFQADGSTSASRADYYIAPGESAIQIYDVDTAYINTGGLAIGDGQAGSRSVIKIENSNAAEHENWGILSSHNLPGFGFDPSFDLLLGNPIDFFTGSPDYSSVLDIWDDVIDIREFAMYAGQMGSIANLNNYRDAANDHLLRTRSVGSYSMDNRGLMVGRADLDNGTNRINNYNTWFTRGENELNESGVLVNMEEGFVQTAFGGDVSDSTVFNALRVRNDGVFSLVDGEANDTASANFYAHPGQDGWGGQGYVAHDLDFYNNGITGASDQLNLAAISGGNEFFIRGSNGLIANVVSTMSGQLNDEIGVVNYTSDANVWNNCSGACVDGDAYYISEYSDGYFESGGVGMIQDGLLAWYLANDEGDERFEYRSMGGPLATQLPGLITQAQNVWYETNDVVADHIRADRFSGSGLSSTANADLVDIIPEAPVADTTNYNSKGVWAKVQGSWTDRDTGVVSNVGNFSSSYDQDIYSVLGGFDMELGQNNPLRIGVFGGYINSSSDYDFFSTTSDAEGGTVGAYVDYTKNNFYVDATFKADFLSSDFSTNVTGMSADTGSADVTNYGVRANAGYRFNGSHGFFEPIVSAAYVRSDIDDFALGGITASFSNGDSFRAGAGARVGTSTAMPSGMRGEFSLLGKVWNEFENANQVTLVDGVGNTQTFTDGINGVFGEVEGVVSLYNASMNGSAFVSGGAEFNSDFTTYNARAGFRWSW